MPESNPCPSGAGMAWFATTHWSVVLNAAADDSLIATKALEQLCKIYWKPVNLFTRSRAISVGDPDDLTQQFFARFLEKKHYRLADKERGRFRAFLLTAVKHFLINEWDRATAQKRGRGKAPLSLDEMAPDHDEPNVQILDERTADRNYDQSWALTLLNRSREKLAGEYAAAGKTERFQQLEQLLPGEETALTYAQVAERLGVAEGTIKSDIHRLKRRYREILREEVANTVATPGEIDAELRYLLEVLGQPRVSPE